jgi:hypothetical protein
MSYSRLRRAQPHPFGSRQATKHDMPSIPLSRSLVFEGGTASMGDWLVWCFHGSTVLLSPHPFNRSAMGRICHPAIAAAAWPDVQPISSGVDVSGQGHGVTSHPSMGRPPAV